MAKRRNQKSIQATTFIATRVRYASQVTRAARSLQRIKMKPDYFVLRDPRRMDAYFYAGREGPLNPIFPTFLVFKLGDGFIHVIADQRVPGDDFGRI
jgi:hypothetical protein